MVNARDLRNEGFRAANGLRLSRHIAIFVQIHVGFSAFQSSIYSGHIHGCENMDTA